VRPTEEDEEALDLLLANDRIPEQSAVFLEGLVDREVWSPAQCRWFDNLCERYIA
jgi:hypothetical protein